MKAHRIFIRKPAPDAGETALRALYWEVVLTTWPFICRSPFATPEARARLATQFADVLARAQAAQHRHASPAAPRGPTAEAGISAETMNQIQDLLNLL